MPKPVPQRTLVAIVGSGSETDPQALADARALGQLLAEAGAVLVTGGRGGVMAAASQGARESGGLVLGILPGVDDSAANPFVDIALPTGLGEARNAVMATAAAAVIAIRGEYGTLSELALAMKLDKLAIAIGGPWASLRGVIPADDAPAAMSILKEHGMI